MRKKISDFCLGVGMREQKAYLGQTDSTEPITLWNSFHLGPMAVYVAATVTPVTKQKKLIVVTFPAHQTGLDQGCEKAG